MEGQANPAVADCMSLVAVLSSARHKPSGPDVRIASVARLAWPPDSTGLRDSSRSSWFSALGACAHTRGKAPADRRTCGRPRPLVVRLGPPSLDPGRFTGRPPCGSRSRRHWSCRRRLRQSRGCRQRRGADALHGASGSAEARSRHKQRTLSGVPGCADARLRSCFAGWLNSRSEEMSPVSVFKFPSDTDDHGLVRYFVLRLDRTHEDAGDVHGV